MKGLADEGLGVKKEYAPPEIEITVFAPEEMMTGSGVGDNYGKWNSDWE